MYFSEMELQEDAFVCLVVDDDPDEIEILRRALHNHARDAKFQLLVAQTLEDAFLQMEKLDVHLVILDLNLPDSRGFATFVQFQDRHYSVPVVVVTGHEDEELALRAIRMGAQDYIIKGLYRPDLTLRAMRFAIERHRIISSHLGRAMNDELTGLYNRRGFTEFGTKQLRLSVRDLKDLVLMYVDLDNMKTVNDTFGHEMGDQMLKDTADILRKALRETDIIARMGGDEFVALALGAAPEYTGIIVTRLMRCVQEFNQSKVRPFNISLSLGIASFDPRNPIEMDELLIRADQAMYMDKRSHKDWARSR